MLTFGQRCRICLNTRFSIAAVSFPLILLLYEVFVRRIGFMRVLFGMAPQKKQLPATAGAVVAG